MASLLDFPNRPVSWPLASPRTPGVIFDSQGRSLVAGFGSGVQPLDDDYQSERDYFTTAPAGEPAADYEAIGYAMGRLGVTSRPRSGLALDDELAYYHGRARAELELEAQAFDAGRLAAMDDAAPIPPADWSDDRKGAFIEGYRDGSDIVMARNLDHLRDLRERAENLSVYHGLANHDGW